MNCRCLKVFAVYLSCISLFLHLYLSLAVFVPHSTFLSVLIPLFLYLIPLFSLYLFPCFCTSFPFSHPVCTHLISCPPVRARRFWSHRLKFFNLRSQILTLLKPSNWRYYKQNVSFTTYIYI